jgi:3-oxoacyl-[acyl-carrier-protein] synthase III
MEKKKKEKIYMEKKKKEKPRKTNMEKKKKEKIYMEKKKKEKIWCFIASSFPEEMAEAKTVHICFSLDYVPLGYANLFQINIHSLKLF